MATRDTSNHRRRARKRAGGPASSTIPPKVRARARDAREQAQAAQAQLLQGVQQVWLAGMGAIARAQKDGPAAFQDAVGEGLRLLNQSRSVAQRMVRDAFEGAQETLQSRVGGARDQAQETLDNLESLFQSRVQRAMHQLGVPTAEEIRLLTRRVAELNANVQRLSASARVRKSPAAKPAAKRAKSRSRRKAARPAAK
jgi:poly(hydroxyalkanoate) granule-associated protein